MLAIFSSTTSLQSREGVFQGGDNIQQAVIATYILNWPMGRFNYLSGVKCHVFLKIVLELVSGGFVINGEVRD